MTTDKKIFPFFQKNISITLDNKVLRTGRLLLFSIKDFYLHFTLLTNDVQKNFELPYPFDTYMENLTSNVLILDYRLSRFTKNLPTISTLSKTLYHKSKCMKFFDNVVKIVENN